MTCAMSPAAPLSPPKDLYPVGPNGDDLGGLLVIEFTYGGIPYILGNDGHIPFVNMVDTVDIIFRNNSASTVDFVSAVKDPAYGQGFTFGGNLDASLPGGGTASTILQIIPTDAFTFSRAKVTYTIAGGADRYFYIHFGVPEGLPDPPAPTPI